MFCTYKKRQRQNCEGDLTCDKQKAKAKTNLKDINDSHLKAILANAGVSDNFVLSPLGLTFLNEEQISVPLEELRAYFSDEVGL